MATPSDAVIPSTFLSWFDRTVYCWRPVDEKAQHDFKKIEPKIQDRIRPVLLEAIDHHFDLLACLFGESPIKENARPYIVLASEDARWVRKARELIISSGILRTVPTPFRIEIMPSTPHGTAVPVASYAPGLILSTQDLSYQSLGAASNQATTQTRGYEVFFKPKIDPSQTGIEIYIRIDGNNLRRATGYLVAHEGEPKYLCLTAAHAFASTHDTETEREIERETWGADYRFTIDESIYIDQDATPSGPPGTPRSRSPANIPANTSTIRVSPNTENELAKMSSIFQYDIAEKESEEERPKKTEGASDTETPREHEFELTNVTGKPPNIPNELMPNIDDLETLGNLKHLVSDCDWAVIEVTNEKLIQALFPMTDGTLLEPITNSDDAETVVTAYTYDGRIYGKLLPGSISQKVPGGKTMKRVLLFQAKITGLVRKGDCGSPVFDLSTNKLYGHIISVSEDGRTAFVMSASDTFRVIKNEAKLGPVSCSRVHSWPRKEYSLFASELEMGHMSRVAKADAWMDRHNTLLASRKEFCELPSDNAEGAKILKIAIVNLEEYITDKHLYGKWAEQLVEILSEMAPFAAIRRSSILSTKVTCPIKAGSHALIHRVQMPIGNVDLSSVNWRPNMEPFEKSKTEVTLHEFTPDLIVLVSTFRVGNDRDKALALEIAYYAEKQEILLIVSAPEIYDSRTYRMWQFTDTQMIRAYSADGGSNTIFRLGGFDYYDHFGGLIGANYEDQGILTLGEQVRSTSWRRTGPQLERTRDGTYGRFVSGSGCAAVVAAGIAAMVLRFMQGVLKEEEWRSLRKTNTMSAVLRSMGEIDKRIGLVWIKHWEWFGTGQRERELEKLVRKILNET